LNSWTGDFDNVMDVALDDEFCQRELPAQERQHDDAEFDDEISGCHFKRHGCGEIGTFAEQRAGKRHGCIRARRRRCRHSADTS
jgi:hypothetical protein